MLLYYHYILIIFVKFNYFDIIIPLYKVALPP